uniref:Uncharacterized protein n=1 Tax=Sinorhizobium fredii (strain NBRC 101917 / NGR234) TaxID=394 RepID=Q6W1B9_SINFN|nr:Hypothetical protein RNGR00324 [Sinorhizobium fredii NGR234]
MSGRVLSALTASEWVVPYCMAKSRLPLLGSTRPETLFSHDRRLSACSSKDGQLLACGLVRSSAQECWTLITACLGRSGPVEISGICFPPHRGSISTSSVIGCPRRQLWLRRGRVSSPGGTKPGSLTRALQLRFEREIVAALPVGTGASTEDVFAALEWRRLRLRQDQQVPEWAGVRKVAVEDLF